MSWLTVKTFSNFLDLFFLNSELKTYENITKITTGKGDDYTTGCLLDYFYFKENYKMIAIDLSKQQVLDADSKAIQQINFTANLDRAGTTTMFFIIKEAKETVLDLSQGNVIQDANPRAIQRINFTADLDRAGNTTMLFIIEEEKETVLDFSQGTVKVLQMQFH